MNYWKRRNRAMNIVRSFVDHIHASPGAARLVIKSPAREARVIGLIQTVDTNAPKRKVLKNGTRRITYK